MKVRRSASGTSSTGTYSVVDRVVELEPFPNREVLAVHVIARLDVLRGEADDLVVAPDFATRDVLKATLCPGAIICRTRRSPFGVFRTVRGSSGCLAMTTSSFGLSSTATSMSSTGSPEPRPISESASPRVPFAFLHCGCGSKPAVKQSGPSAAQSMLPVLARSSAICLISENVYPALPPISACGPWKLTYDRMPPGYSTRYLPHLCQQRPVRKSSRAPSSVATLAKARSITVRATSLGDDHDAVDFREDDVPGFDRHPGHLHRSPEADHRAPPRDIDRTRSPRKDRETQLQDHAGVAVAAIRDDAAPSARQRRVREELAPDRVSSLPPIARPPHRPVATRQSPQFDWCTAAQRLRTAAPPRPWPPGPPGPEHGRDRWAARPAA